MFFPNSVTTLDLDTKKGRGRGGCIARNIGCLGVVGEGERVYRQRGHVEGGVGVCLSPSLIPLDCIIPDGDYME